MKRVLVTGGLGYVGGRVADHLRGLGFAVRIVTRRPIDSLPAWTTGYQLVRCDLRDMASDFDGLCDGVDAVVHLAAANEAESGRDPAGALVATTGATIRLLQAAERCRVRSFVYFSTAHVYRTPLTGLCREDLVPRPGHPYGATHRAAEDYVLAARDSGRIDGVVLRLSNAFGAPMDAGVDRWGLLVNDLCRQVATDGVLRLNSCGLQMRNFIPMGDVVRAVSHVLSCHGDLGDGLFNLGSPLTLSVRDMACRVAERASLLLGRQVELRVPQPAPGEHTVSLDYDISRLAATGFVWNSGCDREIDATLLLCREAFA